jgi:hypothetical protein
MRRRIGHKTGRKTGRPHDPVPEFREAVARSTFVRSTTPVLSSSPWGMRPSGPVGRADSWSERWRESLTEESGGSAAVLRQPGRSLAGTSALLVLPGSVVSE